MRCDSKIIRPKCIHCANMQIKTKMLSKLEKFQGKISANF